MARTWQLTFDAADPAALGGFWAEALGYVEQPPPEGFDDWPSALAAFGVSEDQMDAAYAIVDPEGVGPRIYLQKVPEGKVAKNRLHLDVPASAGPEAPSEERLAAERELAERLVALGATEVEVKDEAGHGTWIVMQDPEGNEFCIT